MRWIEALYRLEKNATPCVLASIINTQGSTPRGVDAKMVITETEAFDTIGGGAFEQHIIERARAMLDTGDGSSALVDVPLGPDLEQCCGGYVGVLLEPQFFYHRHLIIFGAGHISNAIAKITAELPIKLTRFDTRSEFQGANELGTVLKLDNIAQTITCLDGSERVLIMTHDHAIDYEIITALLNNQHAGRIGLIGSKTKAARFKNRLLKDGYEDEAIHRIECPIAKESTSRHEPMAIAVSICHALLKEPFEEIPDTNATTKGVDWNKLKPRH